MMVLRGLRNNGHHHFSHEVASDVLTWSIENGMQGRDPEQPIEDVDLEGIRVYAEYFEPQFERVVGIVKASCLSPRSIR